MWILWIEYCLHTILLVFLSTLCLSAFCFKTVQIGPLLYIVSSVIFFIFNLYFLKKSRWQLCSRSNIADEFQQFGISRWSARVRHFTETGVRKPADGRGSHVGGLPVPRQRGSSQDPHCHDDHHLQENLWQLGYSVEVSFNDTLILMMLFSLQK